PAVHADLSTRRVLASDRVRGLPIDDLRSPEHAQALRDRLGGALLALALRELCEANRIQTDPDAANYLFLPESARIALLDFGSILRLGRETGPAYRALLVAAVEGSERELADVAARLGFLRGDEAPDARRAWLELARCAAEPLRAPGTYD